jgi:hypothetical protein
VILEPPDGEAARWSCTVWPVADLGDAPRQLVVECATFELIEGAKQRQRAVAQELLLGALRAQDAAGDAAHTSERSKFLAEASRDLALSLDESATRETIQRLTLPRPGTWCIVDVVESNGAIHRLAAIHPDREAGAGPSARSALAIRSRHTGEHGRRTDRARAQRRDRGLV